MFPAILNGGVLLRGSAIQKLLDQLLGHYEFNDLLQHDDFLILVA